MLTVNIICVGKLKEKFLLEAQKEYEKRLSAFCRLNVIELPENKLSDNPSASQIAASLDTEAKAILKKAKGKIIALCIEGDLLSSVELSRKLEVLAVSGTSELSFVIGGSFGLSDEIKNKASIRLSMSKMTFPHHLARIMVMEQIYRAFNITANTKYHK